MGRRVALSSLGAPWWGPGLLRPVRRHSCYHCLYPSSSLCHQSRLYVAIAVCILARLFVTVAVFMLLSLSVS